MRISDWSSDVCSSVLPLQPRDVQAGLVGDRQYLLFGKLSARTHKRHVVIEIFALAVRRERGLRRETRNGPEARTFLPQDADGRISLQQLRDRRARPVAVAALIVDELDPIGRARVRTPVTIAHLVCRLPL